MSTSAPPIGLSSSAELLAGEANAFIRLIDDMHAARGDAINLIRAGLPAIMLKDASSFFEVPISRIRRIVRVPDTTAAALAKRGAYLDAGASERLWRLADLVNMAADVFENRQSAMDWLRTANATFQNAAPMDFLDTEPGANSVRQVLSAIAHGGAA